MDEPSPPKRESSFPLFSKNFATHPQDVVDYAHTIKKQMEDFIEAFRKRIDIEMNYSKGLANVSKSLDKYIKPGTELAISFICSAFKVQHQQRGRQALDLAQSLKTQIQLPCTQILKNYTATIKKMQKDIKRFYKQAENMENNHASALESYQGINRQMEQMIITKNIMKYTSGIPQEKKLKLIAKTMESIKENKQYQKLYLQSVKSFNQFADNYNKEITNQLDQAETMIREQVITQGDCLRKLIVAQVSMFKNIQYDILNISKQMEHLDTQKDVQAFVEQQKNNFTNKIIIDEYEKEDDLKKVSLPTVDTPNNSILEQKRLIAKSLLSQSLFNVEQDYFSLILFNKKNSGLRDAIQRIWKSLKGDLYKNNTITIALQVQQQKIESISVQKVPQQKNENGPQSSQPTQIEQIKQEKTPEIISINKDVNKEQQTDKQLKDTLATLKIIQPPNFIPIIDKLQKTPSQQDLYTKFKQITNVIALLWNNSELNSQAVNNSILILQNNLSQHHIYRLIALIFVEHYRIQQQVVLNDINSAQICGQVIKSILVESLRKNDIFIIRGVLGLIFTFYWNQDKNKRLLYQIPEVYQCQVWKKNDFWQASIFETTYQQMAIFTTQLGQSQAETILRQKNIIFSQLASYCHYMVMMGITAKSVRMIVGRYCRLYQMTEQQNKDLSRMITNTNKQYKQALLPTAQKINEKERTNIYE